MVLAVLRRPKSALSVDDEPHSGCPSSLHTADVVRRVTAVVNVDRQLGVQDTASKVGDRDTVCRTRRVGAYKTVDESGSQKFK